jgi:hypothetical protein
LIVGQKVMLRLSAFNAGTTELEARLTKFGADRVGRSAAWHFYYRRNRSDAELHKLSGLAAPGMPAGLLEPGRAMLNYLPPLTGQSARAC